MGMGYTYSKNTLAALRSRTLQDSKHRPASVGTGTGLSEVSTDACDEACSALARKRGTLTLTAVLERVNGARKRAAESKREQSKIQHKIETECMKSFHL